MPTSPFAQAGAMSDPSEYAPLNMDRYFTGLVTQRSLLRDAAVPYLYEKFYSAGRIDSLWDGLNVEISSKLTLIRRPGHLVYNSQTFPAITRFYDFRVVVDGVSSIRTIADTATAVYDATGPNTKTLLFTKSAGTTGKTCFLSIGNALYFSTGPDQKKWLYASKAWAATKTFSAGDWILDPNNNIQLVPPQQTAIITSVSITGNVLTVNLAGRNPFAAGKPIQLSGLTEAPFLNGETVTVLPTPVVNGFSANFVHADYAAAADTGTATYGVANGVTGSAAPAWNDTIGGTTTDGTLTWECWGSSVQNWGIVAPSIAPSVTQGTLPSIYDAWSADTYYSTSLSIEDSNGNIQVLKTPGTTGSSAPVWSAVVGGVTNDGTAQWTCQGTATRLNNAGYALDRIIVVTYTYYPDGYPVTVSQMFRVTTAGITGNYPPDWSLAPSVGSTVADGSIVWTNIGNVLTWADIGATTKISLDQIVIDSNGYLQAVTAAGKSGSAAPTWSTTVGATTVDGAISWLNKGQYSAANTGAWRWVFAYKCSIDGTVSSASPQSVSLVVGADGMAVLQGPTSSDSQVDTIVIFRTNQSGSVLLYDDEFPMPSGATWTYDDTSPDDDLDALILAPLNGVNNPPPTGIVALELHCGRIFAAVQNRVYFCTGPDITIGNQYTQWSESNQFGYPDVIARLWAINISNGALLVFTASDLQSVMGTGTSASPFFPSTYARGIGLLSGDAIDMIGSTLHLFTTAQKQISLDPSAGYTETGFPIGDQFKLVTTGGIEEALYDPLTTKVTWHESDSGDTALYVGDGQGVGWFRYSPVSAPESGSLWSPRAAIQGGISALKSCEVSPGVRRLLMGPLESGPILMRDDSVNSDNEVVYDNTYAVLGSLQLAQAGEVAEIAFITLDSKKVGTAPTVALLLGEIEPTDDVPFEALERTSQDPPLLPPSETLFNDRFSTLQNGVAPLCRHLQMLFQWSAEDQPSELLQHFVYGAKHEERKQQL